MPGHHIATAKKYRVVQASGWAAIVDDDLVSIGPRRQSFLEIHGRDPAR
jgi:hypothetical protein